VETVNTFNDHINSLLNTIASSTFFKYFRVNLVRECPFWVVNYMCQFGGERGCSVCECDENEIPVQWKMETTDRVDRTISPNFKSWDDLEDNVWSVPESDEKDLSYVNLDLNKELMTNYEGYPVWRAIYNENCFQQGKMDNMCF